MNKSKSEILSEMSKLIHYFADLVEDLANVENPVPVVEVQADVVEEPKPQEAPKDQEQPTISIEQVREVLGRIAEAGLTAKVRELLNTYGAKKLSDVNPKDYASLKTKAEALKNA